MKHYTRNIVVLAENNGNQHGFNVYLVFSGQREYLFTHRHNGPMYSLLKDGVRVADMQRSIREKAIPTLCGRKGSITVTKQLLNSMQHLLIMIDDYIKDREQCA